jgi:hypothetical protein
MALTRRMSKVRWLPALWTLAAAPRNAFLADATLQTRDVRGIRPERTSNLAPMPLSTQPEQSARTRPAASMRARFAVILGASLAVIGGCGVQQRAAESLIDPQLHREGVLVERQQGVRDLELGPYRVVDIELADEPFDGSGPLAPDANGRTRPTQQMRLGFSLVGGAVPWTARCIGQHRQPADHDLAAIAGDPRDEIAVRCELAGGDQTWTLELDGDLGGNLLGHLYATVDPSVSPGADGPPTVDGGSKTVEVLLWHRLWNISRRRLPAALALIRSEAGSDLQTEAALILDKPERAWLHSDLDDSGRELALTAMLALRLLPLGFE